MSLKFRSGTPNLFLKYGNYVNFYEYFDFSLVVENIYSTRTAIS